MCFILMTLILLQCQVLVSKAQSQALICNNLELIATCTVSSFRVTASHGDTGPEAACLHKPRTEEAPASPGGWVVDPSCRNIFQWIQADLGWRYAITSFSTQGFDGASRWVLTCRFLYREDGDGENWHIFTNSSGSEILLGNSDSDTVVTHECGEDIRARFVRINPRSFYISIGFRWEVYGYVDDDFSGQGNIYDVYANTKADIEAYQSITTTFAIECTDKCTQHSQCWACNFNLVTHICELHGYSLDWVLIDNLSVTFYRKSLY